MVKGLDKVRLIGASIRVDSCGAAEAAPCQSAESHEAVQTEILPPAKKSAGCQDDKVVSLLEGKNPHPYVAENAPLGMGYRRLSLTRCYL